MHNRLLILVLLFISCHKEDNAPPPTTQQDTGWELIRDFNLGNDGERAQRTADGFDDVAGHSYYTSDHAFEGEKSAELNILEGKEGWGTWGRDHQFSVTCY